ncbi:MAG: pyruvate kinase, partial [Victivallales bacterium]|nr:pyruvate kinase [Victivallales bacterium]
VTITTRDVQGKDGLFSTTYAGLPKDVRPGERILLDDGNMELTALEVTGDEIRCRVLVGGVLHDHKGINLPGTVISTPAVTEKDRRDLAFCLKHGVDYIGQSFVRQASDVHELRTLMGNVRVPIVAKIEKPQALDDFDAILREVDAVMVARGDLGVEMNPEKVPLIQKHIIRACNLAGKPVITATQMLESMIHNPRPTRAETSDIANAILDGSDAVMLSGETAVGEHALEAVEMMGLVADDVEKNPEFLQQPFLWKEKPTDRSEIIARAACKIAEQVRAQAILISTQTGRTAMLVAKYRPSVPVLAVTQEEAVRRRMVLYRSIRSLRVISPSNLELEEHIACVKRAALASGRLKEGDVAVLVMGSPISAAGTTNLIKVETF